MDEKELISKVIKRNQEAIKIFYKKYSSCLSGYIQSKIEKREDAEEILQDTLISLLDSLPLFSYRCLFTTWAMSIARHEVADFYRKRKIKSFVFSKLPFLENLVSEALGPDLVFQQKEAKEEIGKALSYLNEGYSRILRLKYIEGHSMAKIGSLLNLSVKAVESRLSRARLAFQKQWRENYQAASFTSLPFSPLKRGI